jgi:hypothetical protein
MDDTDHYYKLLSGQRGGDFPVFKGSRFIQYGNGFGDVLRGIWRMVFPVVARGASTFLQDFAKNKESGADWRSAAKGAVLPSLTQAGDELGEYVGVPGAASKLRKMVGLGKRRKRSTKSILYKGKKAQSKRSKLTFTAIPKYNF